MKLYCKTNVFQVRNAFLRPLLTGGILCLMIGTVRAQSWLPPSVFTGSGSVAVDFVRESAPGHRLIGGTFDQEFQQVQSLGDRDFFIGMLDAGGAVERWWHGGSALEDQLRGLQADGNGNFYAGGTFWGSMSFGALSLSAQYNPKAIFLIKSAIHSEVVWAEVLSGSGIKDLVGLETDPFGNVFIAGYFSDSLFLPGGHVVVSVGQTDMFVAKLSATGLLMWVRTGGATGDTRATALAVDALGRVYVTGYFNKTCLFGATLLTANTSDKDVFTVAYGADGVQRWARKAGGVHDDDVSAVVVDDMGQIYIGGYFVGVLQAENQVLSSQNGFPDVFIIQYNEQGQVVGARGGGGLGTEVVSGLAVAESVLWLYGHYQGTLILDGYNSQSGGEFRGFYAMLDKQSLQVQGLGDIPASGASYIRDLRQSTEGVVMMAGTAQGQVMFPDGSTTWYERFGGFVAVSGSALSRAQHPKKEVYSRYGVYPNPGRGQYQVIGVGRRAELL